MTNKCGRTRQWTNNLRVELIWGMNFASELATVYYYTPCIYYTISGAVAILLRQVTKLGVSLRKYNDMAVIDNLNEK